MLINVDRLSITGADYLDTLADKLEGGREQNNLLAMLTRQNNVDGIVSPKLVDELEEELQIVSPEEDLPKDKLSVILKRDSATHLQLGYQDKLRDGIAALQLLSAPGRPATMTQFIHSFQQHFEGQTLPLLQALDPEAGVGYQQRRIVQNFANASFATRRRLHQSVFMLIFR